MTKQISIDIYSDTICPWCYIGLVRILELIKYYKSHKFNIIWRPFQLNPQISVDGMDRQLYLKNKFNSKDNANFIYRKIEDEGIKANIYFQFDKIKITPNSFLSHKLLAFAHKKQKQTEVLESIFYQYFIEGNNIGDIKILLNIAEQTKIFDEDIENYLFSEDDNQNLLNEESQARNIGVTGVPCFIINKEFVIKGAQPTENFIKIINSI